MRLRGRVDRNQAEIVAALKQAGASVLSLSDMGGGVPDLLVALGSKTVLFEVKDPLQPPSKRKLTEHESEFHKKWTGDIAVIHSAEEALKILSQGVVGRRVSDDLRRIANCETTVPAL